MATYYVRKTGSNSNSGSSSSPRLTINSGLSLLAAGDTLVVGNGTYAETVDAVSGSAAGGYKTLKAENKWQAIIQPTGTNNGVTSKGCAYFRIDGMQIKGSGSHGLEIEDSHHLQILNCWSHDNGNSGFSFPRCDFVTIDGTVCNGNARAGWYSGATIWHAKVQDGDVTTPGPRIIVRNSMFYDNWTTGGSTDGNGWLFDDWDRTQPDPVDGTGPVYLWGGLIENCIAFGNGNKGIGAAWAQNCVFRNNVVWHNNIDGSQGTWRGDLSNQSGRNNLFFNNISVCNSASSFGTGGSVTSNTAIGNYAETTTGSAGTVFLYNSTYDTNSPASTSMNVQGSFCMSPLAGGGNRFAVNPLLVNPASQDFNLQALSPCIDAGVSSPYIDPAHCVVAGNDTATSSWAVPYPPYAVGDLVVIHLGSDGNVTHTLPAAGPNGEAIIPIVNSFGDTTTASQRLSAFAFVATSAKPLRGTMTVTPSAAEQWNACAYKIPAGFFDAASPIGSVGTAANSNGAATTAPTPAWTASAANALPVVWLVIDDDPINTTPAGWTLLSLSDYGAISGTLAQRTTLTTASESIASANFTLAGDSSCSVGYLIRGIVARTPQPTVDYDGNPRISGNAIDMGAQEFQSGLSSASASGAAVATAVGKADKLATGAAAGTSTALAVGHAGLRASAGAAVGTTAATGVGEAPLTTLRFPDTMLAASGTKDSGGNVPPLLLGDLDDDDPSVPDALWWSPAVAGQQIDVRLGFPTPQELVGLQRFRVPVRPTGGSGTPTVTISLYEAGALVRNLLQVPVVSPVTLEATWDPAELADQSGADVEIRITSEAGA